MSPGRQIVLDVLLTLTAISVWLGVIGMVRMRDPFQALHYLTWPAIGGMGSLTVAVIVQTGFSSASWKCIAICLVLLASNSVGTHAAARAFRARKLGHWEPLPSDGEIEFLGEKPQS